MKKFQFSLEKIRRLREARLEAEQALLRSLVAERGEVERRRMELDEEEARARGSHDRILTGSRLSGVMG